MLPTRLLKFLFLWTIILIFLQGKEIFSKPLYIGGGLGPLGFHQFSQSYFTPFYVAFTKGAADEEVKRLNAKEQDAIQTWADANNGNRNIPAYYNPSQGEGGCPDADISTPEEVFLVGKEKTETGAIYIPLQTINVYGRGCSVTDSSADSLGLLAVELDFLVQYEYLSWLFFRTGLSVQIALPISFSIGLSYTGEAYDVRLAGEGADSLRTTGVDYPAANAGVKLNSKAVVSYWGHHIQIPLLVGINLYKDDVSAFYWAYGLNFSNASFFREVEGSQAIRIETTSNNDPTVNTFIENEEYERVINEDRLLIGPGLLTIMGARRQVTPNLHFYVEFRWHLGGAPIRTRGTQKRSGVKYASDTVAAIALNTVAPTSVAQPLQTAEEPSGGRISNGLILSYEMKLLFGLITKFDY